MIITFFIHHIEWDDYGGFSKGDTVTVQLGVQYPLAFGRGSNNVYLKPISSVSGLYEISGKLLITTDTKIQTEMLIDCGIPVRISSFLLEKKFDAGSFVSVLGLLSGHIDDPGKLYRPVVAKILDIKKIGSLNLAYLITIELTNESDNKQLS